jgi:H+/Cl- antiporter ClcA
MFQQLRRRRSPLAKLAVAAAVAAGMAIGPSAPIAGAAEVVEVQGPEPAH